MTTTKFHQTFGAPLARFASKLSYALGHFDFDLIAFNEWCVKKHGYKEDGKTSLDDFVKKHWGTNAFKVIENLIDVRSSPEHKLIIKSLFDAQAKCAGCGWHYLATGERSRSEIRKVWEKSHATIGR